MSPHGRLQLVVSLDAPPLDFALADRLGTAFSAGSGCGLLQLGAREVGTPLPPQFAFWRAFAARYVTALCALGQLPAEDDDSGPRRDPGYAGTDLQVPPPPGDRLAEMAAAAPPMAGGEYLDRTVLAALWGAIGAAVATELSASGASLADFLRACNPGWNLVGRVHFNLAENRKDPDAPFAFMATYTTRLSERNVAQHLPLGQALRASAGEADRARLMSLLQPVGRAAESCGWLKEMVDRGEIYHPLRWTAPEAFRLLRDVPALERAGVIVRMPAAWTSGKPDRPQVTATVGSAEPGHLGTDALLDFHVAVTLDGETLTASEVEELLAQSEGLALLRGRWVEIDHERLARLLDRYREIERTAADGGLGYQEAMRLLAGAGAGQEPVGEMNEAAQPWSQVVAGPWLANVLRGLRSPEGLAEVDPGEALAGTLRHYQEVGLRWLHLLTSLGLGACLADDMGLGKTIQVLALLLVRKSRQTGGARPSLLVAPASLLANWAAEAQRFAPSLAIGIAHPSGAGPAALASFKPEAYDLVITTYGQLQRLPALARLTWDLAILDEAQAIKNPAAKQTRAAKGLRAHGRIVLTGT
ncbi:MAG: ATP-dependent helicase, partial [Candidatus Sericytochromatia bacterium]|nr:ATP-dependent helicase [Candidatus Tanganyikabacteria bacterium]